MRFTKQKNNDFSSFENSIDTVNSFLPVLYAIPKSNFILNKTLTVQYLSMDIFYVSSSSTNTSVTFIYLCIHEPTHSRNEWNNALFSLFFVVFFMNSPETTDRSSSSNFGTATECAQYPVN